MRLLLSGILVWLVLSTAFRDVLVLSAFKLNRDYIAKNLCVNRDLQNNMCHGTCQLKIELEKNHDEQKTTGFRLLSDQLPITFFYKSQEQINGIGPFIKWISPTTRSGVYISTFLFRLFRPPEV